MLKENDNKFVFVDKYCGEYYRIEVPIFSKENLNCKFSVEELKKTYKKYFSVHN